jgi:hypothetical protein
MGGGIKGMNGGRDKGGECGGGVKGANVGEG